jgi:hypothetical protein
VNSKRARIDISQLAKKVSTQQRQKAALNRRKEAMRISSERARKSSGGPEKRASPSLEPFPTRDFTRFPEVSGGAPGKLHIPQMILETKSNTTSTLELYHIATLPTPAPGENDENELSVPNSEFIEVV